MKKIVVQLAAVLSFHENFNKDNISILQEMGFDVYLIANEKSENYSENRKMDFYEYCNNNQIKILPLDIPRSPFRFISLLKSYLQLINIFNNIKVELIHSHTPVGGLLGRLIAKKFKIKSLYTAHGFHFYKGAPILNWLFFFHVEKWLSRFTDGIITINKEDYGNALRFNSNRKFYIPGVGVNTNNYYFNNKNITSNFVKFISIGELNRNKNHLFIIRQLLKLNIAFEYNIAGNGFLKNRLQTLIDNSKKSENIKLLGFVDDIPNLLSNQDIFIMPSLREGLPVALMEAMATGLPILASDIRGIRDLVDDGLGGFLFDPNNIGDFKEKLNILLRNPELRNQMGLYNLNKVKECDITKIREQMMSVYSQIIEETPKP